MRKIILYIACSLDGYIAKSDGSVDWLDEIPNPEKSDYGYAEFYNSIDTVIMGNKTYQQVLEFGIEYPYKGKKSIVLTKNSGLTKDENAEFISKNIPEFLNKLKNDTGKNIWCVGGGEINSFLLGHQLIDEIKVFMMPVILGSGIPFTPKLNSLINLQLIKQVTYQSGVQELDYLVKK